MCGTEQNFYMAIFVQNRTFIWLYLYRTELQYGYIATEQNFYMAILLQNRTSIWLYCYRTELQYGYIGMGIKYKFLVV